jgi:Zn-finger nucleic acid-binding protein
MIERICPVCTQTFQAKQRHRVTCSDKCRQRRFRLGGGDRAREELERLLERWREQAAAERRLRDKLVAAGVDLEVADQQESQTR